MRKILFKPSRVVDREQRRWLAKWLARARRATAEALDEASHQQTIAFKVDVWSDLKQFLLKNVFHGKCAYCESRVTTTDFGDAEHYRPKGGVTQIVANKRVFVCVNGQQHRGYYWLAYDWRNILPACAQCNSGTGKQNQFPIGPGRQYVDSPVRDRYPAALDALESPQLLHPYFDEPEQHLRFGEDGTVAAAPNDLDDRGLVSIETYKLDRGDLATSRKEYQEKAWSEFLKALGNDTPLRSAMAKYERGESPYSLACLHYVKEKFRQKRSEYD